MLSKENLEDVYPLSPMQEGILFQSLLDERSASYFEQISYRLRGSLDLALFRRAWEAIVARHEILRTVFKPDKARRPLQLVLKRRELPLMYADLRGMEIVQRGRDLIGRGQAVGIVVRIEIGRCEIGGRPVAGLARLVPGHVSVLEM